MIRVIRETTAFRAESRLFLPGIVSSDSFTVLSLNLLPNTGNQWVSANHPLAVATFFSDSRLVTLRYSMFFFIRFIFLFPLPSARVRREFDCTPRLTRGV